jgi:hypothetical protein
MQLIYQKCCLPHFFQVQQGCNDSLVPAVVVCGYENCPRRIFEKKGHRREQIIKIFAKIDWYVSQPKR